MHDSPDFERQLRSLAFAPGFFRGRPAVRLLKRNNPTKVVDLTVLSSRDPAARENAAKERDRAAAERELGASHRDRLLGDLLDKYPEAGAPSGLEESVGARNWPAIVHHMLKTAAADRHQAASDRKAAAEDRHAAERDRAFASRDDLTGAWRRDAGLRMLTAEMNRAVRTGSSLVVGYLDVAGFKAINDAYGHPTGDKTLASLVRTLRVQLRSYDSVIRMGGDEFVCVLPETPLSAANRRFEQLQDELRRFEPPITVRVGFASLEDDDTAWTLLSRADDALLATRGLPRAMRLVTN
jgi:diguanylate cyclase (GGDEF)-like protein